MVSFLHELHWYEFSNYSLLYNCNHKLGIDVVSSFHELHWHFCQSLLWNSKLVSSPRSVFFFLTTVLSILDWEHKVFLCTNEICTSYTYFLSNCNEHNSQNKSFIMFVFILEPVATNWANVFFMSLFFSNDHMLLLLLLLLLLFHGIFSIVWYSATSYERC